MLNATAELMGTGDLLISGDATDDVVDVTLNTAGEIEIFDANGLVPIRIGTDGAGNPITTNSLDPSKITSNRLTANLGAGNDSLRIDVPVGLNVSADGGIGSDSLDISLNADASNLSSNTLILTAEDIRVDGGGDDIDFATSTLLSDGAGGLITIDNANQIRLGEIDVVDGSLQIGDVGAPVTDAISQAAGTGISADLVSIYAAGDVDLSSTANSVDTIDLFLDAGVSGVADGNIHLVANTIHVDGGGDDIDFATSTLLSDGAGGLITIDNANQIRLGEIDVVDGSLQIGDVGAPVSDAISQAAGTGISADLVSIYAAGDVDLSSTANSIDTIDLFLDAGVSGVADGNIHLVANTIHVDGGGDDIDFATSTLLSDGAGGLITIDNANQIRLGEIDVVDGSLQIGDVGAPVSDAISQAAGTGISADLVSIYAAGDVDLSSTGNSIGTVDRIVSGGTVDVHSNVNGLPGATLTVHQIETASGGARGDINISVTGSLDLVSTTIGNDNVLNTENGEINIVASGDIRILDQGVVNDGSGGDREIIAGGDNGRLMMSAGNAWIAGDSIQIYASQVSDAAVRINAPSVVIGNDFEINTGNGVGIAHRFAPRPELTVVAPGQIQPVYPGVITDPTNPNYVKIETAFYDVESIETDILTQANENDASGVLSIDIGAAGENGLSLFIDWGGISNRFEQLDNLPGDHTRVDVSHVYLESDILNSTLNGRGSATDPLAVRFAVSHHASIVVTGDSVEQTVPANQIATAGGPTLQNSVPGRLISSTDNPLTAPLESGRAFFVIPRVNVPMAFFPVRDVLPEPIEPTPPVILTSSVQLSSVVVDTVESSASPPSIRDEYFQLRTLSPDPNGEDLIEPIRLPDSILAEDRLDELFAELPDGAYEIDYVIGNSEERLILRVDLRGGKAIIVENEIEGAPLELEVLDLPGQIEMLDTVPANELDDGSR
ncbi:beta strand repeat-containing protein [Allorhodopirellula heiligendammensis]|uniref:beta strand repeat-containing protein n=1 Tax=Allorhodopirellula heiligendammensis TaxID=2714739 RepID=UPI0011B3DADC|nr:hypothetical protein [Allorhodopirellula heiligendammensis]